ncbi:hypothetical protein F5B20DRAFT_156990 [Whalleya microplaca]|nr:hypothetical protein F5B20DRAFT_156990 [Whalleya microplaca]
MAPLSHSRSALIARRGELSPGAIAGTVVGCVVGGSLLLVVLGFLYFRYRRKSIEAKADFLQAGRNTGFPPGQDPATQNDHPYSMKDERPAGAAPDLSNGNSLQHSPTAAYGDNLRDHEGFYVNQALGQPPLPPDIDFSLPARGPTFSAANESNYTAQPLDYDSTAPAAANSSYYDTRISMDSDPAQPPLPHSPRMAEMYEAQLRDSREQRKRSGSLTSRIWSSIKRKRSTHSSSHGTNGAQNQTSPQYFPSSPVESPVSYKQESGFEFPPAAGVQPKTTANRYFEEPAEMSETAGELGSGRDRQQQQKRQKRWGGDSQYDDFPLRTDSARRETTERDPELPSSALQGPGSTNGRPPLAQPQSETSPQERLGTPDIPEPMDIAPTHEDTHRASVFRNSQSPPLEPEAFVSPMAIMRPSNTIEQAAYTTYQMDHSPSPPELPTPPPDFIADQPMPDHLAVPGQEPYNDGDSASYLSIQSDDEPRRSGESYDYSTTPGQSTTDTSIGRTPDTRITISPSPYPTVHEYVKMEPESSSSPEASRLSPQSPGLMCEECGRQFDQIHKLNHHKRYHERKHECPYEGCDKRFGTKTHLDRHINDKHVKSKSYHCTEPTCSYFKGGKAFPRKDNWRRHMIKKHGAPNDTEPTDEPMEGV